MLFNCSAGEDSWESLALQGNPTSPSLRRSVLGVHWKDCCWSWNSNTLATWCEEPAYWKRSWHWERLKAGGEEDDRGWDGWMASPTRWTWTEQALGLVINREAWCAAVHGVTKSRIWLNDWTDWYVNVIIHHNPSKEYRISAFLVVQWLRICLPM